MTSRYAGADWIRKSYGIGGHNISPLGESVADLLGDVFAGIYHLDMDILRAVDWTDTYVIVVPLYHTSLSTYDNEVLTKLVVLSHDRCLRMSVTAVATVNPHDIRRAIDNEWKDDEIRDIGRASLELMFHQRSRTGDISKRLPTMEQHLDSLRRYYPAQEEFQPCLIS